MNESFLSPSQVIERIQELRQKMEFDILDSEEKDELKELKDILSEFANDYQLD
jgi:uncharacterized Fe-S cluster-containing radical SAM superfamily protein